MAAMKRRLQGSYRNQGLFPNSIPKVTEYLFYIWTERSESARIVKGTGAFHLEQDWPEF